MVTAVCNTKNVAPDKSPGADKVIDCTQQDFTKTEQTFDSCKIANPRNECEVTNMSNNLRCSKKNVKSHKKFELFTFNCFSFSNLDSTKVVQGI